MQRYDDEIQLKDILIKFSEYKAFLLKKKFLIFISSFLFCIVGVIFAIFSDTKYNAELTFVVEQDAGASAGAMHGRQVSAEVGEVVRVGVTVAQASEAS